MIYVCCHKDYEKVPEIDKESYCLITGRDIKNNSDLNLVKTDGKLDDRLWCEIANHYWLSLQKDIPEVVGFCHYRRYFNSPVIDTDMVIPKPIQLGWNNRAAYAEFHNVEDYDDGFKIAKELNPGYSEALDFVSLSNLIIPYNSFILSKHLFLRWCDFIFPVIFKHLENIGVNDYESGRKYVEDNLDKFSNKDVTYQTRCSMTGSLAERLSTAFFLQLINSGASYRLDEMNRLQGAF